VHIQHARFAWTWDALLSAKRSKGGDSLSSAKFFRLMARWRELKVCGAAMQPIADLCQEYAILDTFYAAYPDCVGQIGPSAVERRRQMPGDVSASE
jgi:hypothetical protein